jgi:hypothetical protein
MIRSGRDRLIDNSASSADQRGAWVSLDHLVGAGEQRMRHIEAQRIGGLQINHELLEGQESNIAETALIGGVGALKLAIERGVTGTSRTGVKPGTVQAKIAARTLA